MKKFLVTILFIACTSCASVEQISKDEFKITVKGNGFTSLESLKNKAKSEAKKVCGLKEFKFIPNYFGDDFSFKQDKTYTQYGDVTSGTAIAKIRCLSVNTVN